MAPLLLYYLLLRPLSKLPLGALYALTGGLAWLNWNIIGYRKDVVLANLALAFPDRPPPARRRIAKDYYRFFFESVAESIKLFDVTADQAAYHCRVENPELIDHLLAEGRSVIAVGGHYSNWEIAALSFPGELPGWAIMGIYSPLKNETMNRISHANRSRFGTILVSRREVDQYYLSADYNQRPTLEFFVADQSPSNHRWQKLHWTTFLGQPTGFLAGPERHAVRFDRPVYYMRLRREARGRYAAALVPITDQPRAEEPGFITEAYVRELEREILRDPVPWLWTHRRWKRGVPEEVAELLREREVIAPEYER